MREFSDISKGINRPHSHSIEIFKLYTDKWTRAGGLVQLDKNHACPQGELNQPPQGF